MNSFEPVAPLPPEKLRHAVCLDDPAFETTADLDPLSEPLGQERVAESLALGVTLAAPGFNCYAMGSTGLGRHTLVREALTEAANRRPPASDWCYLANFQLPHRPRALQLPAGRGVILQKQLEQLVEDLLFAMPAAFQGDEYQRRATEIRDELERREDELAEKLADQAEQRGILVMRTDEGYSLMPEKEGKALSPEEYRSLPKPERERIDAAMEEMKEALKETLVYLPQWQLEIQQKLRELDRETARLVVAPLVEKLGQEWQDFPEVTSWLGEIQEEVIRNLALFRRAEDEESLSADDPEFRRYSVNVLVDNAGAEGAPVIYEDNPVYQNLVGRVEYVSRMGALETDFTLIKPGALHRANGGYLLLDAEKLLENPLAWEALKRALRAREVRIESLEYQLGLASTISLEPEPMPIDLKVVLVGDRFLFYELKEFDPEFSLLFKVAADFSEELPRGRENEHYYARMLASLQRKEQLRPITRDGVERILEEAARRTGEGGRLSLHLDSLLDLLREADHQAARKGLSQVAREQVLAALEAQRRRLGQPRERLQEAILKGIVRIDTAGVQLAQVNALTYMEAGDLAFGAPSRVSATARLGSGEFIDIERETELGGPIHTKGVMILTAYLGARYARHQPLLVVATLVFEQSYGMVEGDSASAAELCALLSALGDLPLRQSFAVTGSVNQHGQMQAVGGICEKIEGFFDICRAKGLDGSHGVIIPAINVADLMLREELVEAARKGLFHRCPPWRAKRRRVVPGSREATRDTRRAEGAKGDPKGASERGVQSYGRPVC
ncbi:MAG: Lon protease family protein, partial [Gammaproteobacteria bacterium]